MKKKLLLGLGMTVVSALSVGTTLAYYSQTQETVNTMTIGSVKIEQLEYERVVDDNGNWIQLTGDENQDNYGYYPDELKEFTQDKPLYPAVFKDGVHKWDDRNGSQNASGEGSHQQSWGQVGASGSNQLLDDSMKNVIDKFVFVKNTGDSDAYIRTWFAFEQGSFEANSKEDYNEVIMFNRNPDHWEWSDFMANVDIDGNTYIVSCATYLGPKSNPTGILSGGKTSYPSLLQFYLTPDAGNAEVEALDGNNNGKFDVIVLSQAVQTAGFDNAEEALNAAFGAEHPFN